MENIQKMFGRVFISKEANKWEELRSIKFSNSDWMLYSSDGKLIPDYENFKEKKWSLGFSLDLDDKNESKTQFIGKLHLPQHLGRNIPNFKVPPHGKISPVAKELAMSAGLIYDEDDPLAESIRDGEIFGIVCSPNRNTTCDRLVTCLMVLVAVDDIFEKAHEDTSTTKLPLGFLSKAFQLVKDAVEGESLTISELDQKFPNLDDIDIPISAAFEIQRGFQCSISLFQFLRREALQLGNTQEIQPFLKTVTKSLDIGCLELSKEWNSPEATSSSMFFPITGDLRGEQAMLTGFIEAVALQSGIRLKPEIRQNPVFKYLCKQLGKFFGTLNDIMSFQQELHKTDTNNQVCILHVYQDWNLEKALGAVLEEANDCLKYISESVAILKKMHQDEDLNEFLQIVEHAAIGIIHFHWYVDNTRYHNDLVYDLFIIS